MNWQAATFGLIGFIVAGIPVSAFILRAMMPRAEIEKKFSEFKDELHDTNEKIGMLQLTVERIKTLLEKGMEDR